MNVNTLGVNRMKRIDKVMNLNHRIELSRIKNIPVRVRKFDIQIPNQKYIDRPGSYGIIINDQKNICIVKAFSGYTLPGGGSHVNENSMDTLHREIREETGFQVEIISEIGIAKQFLFAKDEGYSFGNMYNIYLLCITKYFLY